MAIDAINMASFALKLLLAANDYFDSIFFLSAKNIHYRKTLTIGVNIKSALINRPTIMFSETSGESISLTNVQPLPVIFAVIGRYIPSNDKFSGSICRFVKNGFGGRI